MGTKNKPGDFDCYANAAPDEPMFVLLGRDPMAPFLVRVWADAREKSGEDSRKVKEARDCADAMEEYAIARGKGFHIRQLNDYWTFLKGLIKAARDFAGNT